ncbi:MAG: hypothetical protein ACPGDB_05415, partial [Fusobacterium sp.]
WKIPIQKKFQKLFAIKWLGKTLIFKCLSFGLASAPAIYNKFIKLFIALCNYHHFDKFTLNNNKLILQYLDDFFGGHPDRQTAEYQKQFLLEKFEGVFEKANQLILLPVYSAGEKDDFGISLEKLAKKINHPNVKIIKEEKELEKELLKGEKKKVDIFMGAGSISLIAHRFAKKIEGK